MSVAVLIIFGILAIAVVIIPSAETANEHEIILDFSFTEPVITEVNVSNTTYHKVVMNESQTFGGFGLPLLPAKTMKILLPQKGVLKSISIDFSGNTSFGEGYNVILWSESENFSEGQNESNETYFNATLPFPEELYDNFGISNFRGYAILLVNLYPVHYIGDTGEIYYYENMTIKIKTEDTGKINPFFRGLSQDEKIMKQKVDDYSMEYTYTTVSTPPGNSSIVDPSKNFTMVVITREKFVDAKPPLWYKRNWCTFQNLVNHKNSIGINTTIVTIEDILECPEYHWNGIYGDNESLNRSYYNDSLIESIFNDTQCHIRNFIKDAYLNWNISYVLLGGDTSDWIGREILPARYLWAHWKPFCMPPVPEIINLPSDLYYACLDGSFNDDNDKHYSASTPYSYWGTPLDGVGDFWEPIRQKNYYAEIESSNYDNCFGVGLSTPQVDLSNYSSVQYFYINFTYDFEAPAEDNVYGNFSIYSGGNNVSTSHHDYWKKLNKGKRFFTKRYGLSDITDISKVYILFNYTDNINSIKASFNVDNLSIEVDNEVVFEEGFEDPWVEDGNGNLAPPGWEQILYSQNEGKWIQEHYWEGVDLDAEVYVGRAPVGGKKEVSNFVWKTIKYENLTSNDPCLAKVLLVGTILIYDESPDNCIFGGDFCDQLIDYYNSSGYNTTGIPNNTYNISKLYEKLWPDYWWPKNRLLKNLTGNLNFIHNDCHGTTCAIISKKYKSELQRTVNKLGRFDAITLGNDKPFFLSSQSCLVGAFDNYYLNGPFGLSGSPGFYLLFDCLGECLTVKTKQGAFAVRMNARYGIVGSNESSQILDRLFFHEIFNDYVNNGSSVHELGRANQDSKYRVINRVKAQATPTNKINQDCRVIFFGLNLLGDPSVVLKIPDTNNSGSNKPATPKYSDSSEKLYTFYTNTSDPEGDKVSYKFKWDNHECLWTEYYNSGENASKTMWIPSGTHQIRVKSRDIFLNESDWSDPLSVTVPFNSNMDMVSSPVVLGKETQFYGQALQGATLPVLTWNYTFGDGNYSEQQNTNHTYGAVGTYNVTLTVTDSQDITSNVTKIVKVVILKSDINSSSDHGDPTETISFNDLSGGHYNISSWYWDFGDGNTSNNQNTSHAYAGEGVYNVSLNVTDAESNTNVSYQTIYIDAGDPEIASHSSDLDEIGYGYNITITANLSDSVSDIKTATVNVTYPDDTYGNFTMNNTNSSTYEYTFNDTCQLGGYNYKIWAVDHAENLESSSSKNFNVLRSFGCRLIGGSNQSIWDTITGSRFKVNLKGVADNMSVYIDPGNATSDSHYQCVIYRHNDSKLMGISEEKNVTSGKGWQTFNFSVPKPVLINDTEYVLDCWSDNYTVKMFYDDANEEEMFYDDGSSTLIGHYFEGVYNYTPDINNFEHENGRYSIYCRYTPDNTTPEITNVSDTPGTVGFGFNVNITANVTDNASGVDTVQVNITYPDSTTGNFTMNNTGNNTYEYVFSDTWLVGQHDYTIWTVDYAGNINSSSGYSFTVSAQATLSIATLKDSYGANEYINLTDPPSPPQDYYLVGRGLTWNEYYNATSDRNILEVYTSPVNYQNENGSWTPIECNISLINNSHPAYSYGYRAGNDHGLYHVYFKPNAQDNWPVAFAYNKSSDPETHVIRSKLLGVGYLDPSQGWAYEYLQSVQSSQGQIDGNSATYENVFTGTDVVWTYGNSGLKEEIIMSNATKTVLQDHPPSEYGLSNQDSYLVFITKLDYHTLQLYNSSGVLNGNFTTSDGRIDFKDALGRFKCTLPIGEAYELYNESVRHKLVYRVLQYNGNYYLLSGLKAADLNDMTFPVVIDPSLTVYSSFSDGDIMGEGTPYASVQNAAEGSPRDMESTFTIGQRCNFGPYYFIWRAFVFFDTSSIPSNDLIDSATLSLYKDSDFSLTDFDIVVQNGQPTYPHIPLLPFDYDKNRYSGNGGSFNTVGFSSGYNDISLTDYSWINTSGTTKLCLRSSRDINSNTPTGDEYVTVYSSNYPLGGRSPKLVIEYRNQSKIKNTGSTDIKGYLFMKVEYYNISAVWASDYVAVDDTTPRIINSSEQLALDLVFNGLVNTNDLTHGDGTYRVYAAFRDPNGNILQTNDEKDMVSWYAFEVSK